MRIARLVLILSTALVGSACAVVYEVHRPEHHGSQDILPATCRLRDRVACGMTTVRPVTSRRQPAAARQNASRPASAVRG
jgi:hypothetical protein